MPPPSFFRSSCSHYPPPFSPSITPSFPVFPTPFLTARERRIWWWILSTSHVIIGSFCGSLNGAYINPSPQLSKNFTEPRILKTWKIVRRTPPAMATSRFCVGYNVVIFDKTAAMIDYWNSDSTVILSLLIRGEIGVHFSFRFCKQLLPQLEFRCWSYRTCSTKTAELTNHRLRTKMAILLSLMPKSIRRLIWNV